MSNATSFEYNREILEILGKTVEFNMLRSRLIFT